MQTTSAGELTPSIARICQQSKIGKLLPDALYVHVSALGEIDPTLQAYEQQARRVAPEAQTATLVKFHFRKPQISYLGYPEFDTDPHPALEYSIQVDLETLTAKTRDYCSHANPPILHRKETFVSPDYPGYETFAHLTQQQEALGLLKDSRTIGTQRPWHNRLLQHHIEIYHHRLTCPLPQPANSATHSPSRSALHPSPVATRPKIQRHKAAIARTRVSKPVRLAVEAGLFEPDTTYFDYGCGHGTDIAYIQQLGYISAGWDPHFRADADQVAADVVNLGYVINVIEDQAERRQALVNAWHLTQKILIVAAQVLIDDQSQGVIAYGDGIVTRRNTFQKYYEQEELKTYIDQVLQVDAVPIALGIYFVFRDEGQAESFRASRFRSRTRAPQIRLKVNRFEEYKALLEPLMAFYTDRGRLPTDLEALAMPELAAVKETLGSLKRAFKLVLEATDRQDWDEISDRRRQDLLVYLALSQFGKRPKFKDLSPPVQADIKGLFGSYQQACTAADLMLMSLSNQDTVAERCRQSAIGQQRPNSLWVHISALDQLDPLLRLYEGCASRTIGRPEETTVIKFHLRKPQISYLFVPEFDTDPHPAVQTQMAIHLRKVQVYYRDCDRPDNPPLIHQKEQLVLPDYPLYQKFAKLSQQEHNWGLLDDLGTICDRQGWLKCLENHCAELRGHRVVWRKDADPYQRKVLQAAQRNRREPKSSDSQSNSQNHSQNSDSQNHSQNSDSQNSD